MGTFCDWLLLLERLKDKGSQVALGFKDISCLKWVN